MTSRATALIVDDSLTVRMDLAAAFENAGFHAMCCSTAKKAHETLTTQVIDVLILDVVLPDSTGPELLKRIRRGADPHIPVLMLSSEAEVRDLALAQDRETSVVYGMPGEAVRLGATHRILPLSEFAPTLRA